MAVKKLRWCNSDVDWGGGSRQGRRERTKGLTGDGASGEELGDDFNGGGSSSRMRDDAPMADR